MADEGIRTAPLGKRWVRKMAIFIVILLAFGGWGFYDAVWVYPARGERFATWAKLAYLEAAEAADREDFGIFIREASVPNPAEEIARLSQAEQRQRNGADASNTQSPRRLRAIMLNTRLTWLEGLSRIGQVTPERTTIENPRAELARLKSELSTASQPKPLAYWDIPMQWMIMAVCWAFALFLIIRAIGVASRKYRWQPETMTLTLPGKRGGAITPDDLEEVDKRKWDKFIVFLKIKASHPTLGGQEIRCDTYQYDELEEWILAMERKAFGPQEVETGGESGPGDAPVEAAS